MLPEALSTDALAFLRAHIESYEHLAILLLVFRERLRDWSQGELVEMLRIPPLLTATAVEQLFRAGLLRVTPRGSGSGSGGANRYQYASCGATHATIAQLASAFMDNPVQVIRVLNANAIEKVRASAVRTFADAFVLKKKDGGHG